MLEYLHFLRTLYLLKHLRFPFTIVIFTFGSKKTVSSLCRNWSSIRQEREEFGVSFLSRDLALSLSLFSLLHSHTLALPFARTPTHSLTPSYLHSHTFSLIHLHTFSKNTLSHTLTHNLSHTLTHILYLIHSQHILSLIHSHTLSHSLSFSHSCTHSLRHFIVLSFYLSPSHTHTQSFLDSLSPSSTS